MRDHRQWFIVLIPCVVILAVNVGKAQTMPVMGSQGGRTSLGIMQVVETEEWHVYGRVHTLTGEAVKGAKVRMDISGVGGVKESETDLLGHFSQIYKLHTNEYKSLRVWLLVTKPDYQDARMVVDFPDGKTWELDVTMLTAHEDPNQLSQHELVARLAPRLRKVRDELPDSVRRKYEQGAAAFFAKEDSTKALSTLEPLSQKQPGCVDCATLAALAALNSGDWDAATKQITAAGEANEKSQHPRPEPYLVLGVMEMWKGEPAKAANFFSLALKCQPKDPMALEELGRSQLQLNNDEMAEVTLAQAVDAGAPPDARLLRVRALLGMNDAQTASEEMDKYVAGRAVKDLPENARLLYAQLKGRLELAAYGQVKSVLTEKLGEIEKAAPELKGIRPAANQEQLAAILKKVGKSVEDFFTNFPDTVSVEHVQQEMLKKNDKPSDSSTQAFRYLLIAKSDQKGLGLEEYRTNDQGQQSSLGGRGKGFMLTAGFASTSLYFHPAFQGGADFKLLGTQEMQGRRTEVIAFAQNPKRAVIIGLFHDDKATVSILVQGLAWVDAASGQILRMRTDLLKPAEKVRLSRQTTEIAYSPVTFNQVQKQFWLPHEVIVTVDWRGKRFRNEHGYSDFQLFHVKAEENRKTSELRADPQGPM